jgi:hypothetical protein
MRLMPSFQMSFPDAKALRIALASGAVAGLVVLAACSERSAVPTISAPNSLNVRNATTSSGGLAYQGIIRVCVNGAPASWVAKYDSVGVHPDYGFSVLNNFPNAGGWPGHLTTGTSGSYADGYITGGNLTAGSCTDAYVVTEKANVGNADTDAFARLNIKVTPPAGYTLVSTVCDIDFGLANADGTPYTGHGGVDPVSPADQADFYPDCDNDGDAKVWGNIFHGTKVTFTFNSPTTVSSCTLGYPKVTSNPLTNTDFNESEVLSNFGVGPTAIGPTELRVWYTDEHALTLGVSQVSVKDGPPNVTTVTPYNSISVMGGSNPAAANPVNVGDLDVNPLSDQRATDGAGRPIYPALFITNITGLTDNLNNFAAYSAYRANDWQFGGTPTAPNKVYGTWKSASVFLDKTKNPDTRTITPGADPAKNHQNLGLGAPVPPGTQDLGYSAEVVWNFSSLGLTVGQDYRLQFMVHDGDQNKTGGDVGQACINLHWGG